LRAAGLLLWARLTVGIDRLLYGGRRRSRYAVQKVPALSSSGAAARRSAAMWAVPRCQLA